MTRVIRRNYYNTSSVDVMIMLVSLAGCDSVLNRSIWTLYGIYMKSNSQWNNELSTLANEEALFFALSQRPAFDFCPIVFNRSCIDGSSLGLPMIFSQSQLWKCSSSKSSNFFESTSTFLVRSTSCCKQNNFLIKFLNLT